MNQERKSIFTVMIIIIAAKILGFVREIILASIYGATAYTDAYLIATVIPLIIFGGLGGALSTIFVPMYIRIEGEEKEGEGNRFTNNILNAIIIFTLLLSGVGLVFVKPLVRVFAFGFTGETLMLAIKFTRIMVPGIIFIGANYILTGYLQANNRFYITALMGLPLNIIIIISVFFSALWNENILIYGTLIGLLSQFIFQLLFVYKLGFTYQCQIRFKDESLKKMLYLVMPVFLGAAVQQINELIDKTLASTLYEGSIAALNFGNRLNLFVYGVFITSIATVLYPMLSKLATNGDKRSFKNAINKGINMILILIIPTSIGAMCLSTPIIKVLFQRGSFDINATERTARALFYYSIGMTGFGLRDILSKGFYALHDTKTPMINGVIAVIINILLNFVLIKYMGHGGLALATSISALVATILLLYSLRRKIGSIGCKDTLYLFMKILLASLIMAVIVTRLYEYGVQLLGNEMVSLLSSILLGCFIYLIIIWLMGVEEITEIINLIKAKKESIFKGSI